MLDFTKMAQKLVVSTGTNSYNYALIIIIAYCVTDDPFLPVVGRLCEFSETAESADVRERCGPLTRYMELLSNRCVGGSPGTLLWTPDETTPDVVYYQVMLLYTIIIIIIYVH